MSNNLYLTRLHNCFFLYKSLNLAIEFLNLALNELKFIFNDPSFLVVLRANCQMMVTVVVDRVIW